MATPVSVTTEARERLARRAASDAMVALSYPIAIGLSACLLFTLEPMVGQMLLPVLGGAPSVWASTLAFFQIVLLGGYLYAHVSATYFGRFGPVVHAVLGAVALVALALAPGIRSLRFEGLHPVLEILAILTLSVGLPAFVLCTTTPLLSAWLTDVLAARRRTSAGAAADKGSWSAGVGKDPYRLYVVSNAGSLLSLLAYPFMVQPAIGLSAQRVAWTVGFGVLLAFLVFTAAARLRTGSAAHVTDAVAGADGSADAARAAGGLGAAHPLGWRRMSRWLFLAAVPCGLLSAVTNFITADLVSAPMLWVGPLVIYLGTFIVAFSPRGGRIVRRATLLAPAFVTVLWVPLEYPAAWPTVPLLLLELAGFAVVAQTLHGALAADRPEPARLTTFYLVTSAGGVVGGSFVGFVAPIVFPGIWEYPILLVAAILGFPTVTAAAAAIAPGAPGARRFGSGFRPFVAGARGRLVPFLAIGLVAALPIAIGDPVLLLAVVPFVVIGALILLVAGRPRLFATNTAIVLALVLVANPNAPIFVERDFFGVVQVVHGPAANTMWHGTTDHGSQWTDPARSLEPRSYYVREGPLGDVMSHAQSRGGQSFVIVGLGAGGMAAYERPEDRMTFVEIDPAVVHVAEDPSLFTYLRDAPVHPSVITGDGRLELAKLPDASFDVVILDAFSGDAIPTHLITLEALQDDLRLLRPGGLMVVHVSNRYYDLAPALGAGFDRLGVLSMTKLWTPTEAQAERSGRQTQWVVAARSAADLAPLAARGWSAIVPAAQPITDDFPDVLRFARLGSWLLPGH